MIKKLRKQLLQLKKARKNDNLPDEDFRQLLISSMLILDLSDQDLASFLSISLPTVERWKVGKNLPYRLIRPLILSCLGKQILKKLGK